MELFFGALDRTSVLVPNLSPPCDPEAYGLPQKIIRNLFIDGIHEHRPIGLPIPHRGNDSVRAKKFDRPRMSNQKNQVEKVRGCNQNTANPKHVKRKGHWEALNARSAERTGSWRFERELVVPV
jgi:hypothetical protein